MCSTEDYINWKFEGIGKFKLNEIKLNCSTGDFYCNGYRLGCNTMHKPSQKNI